ncbi:MAG TPA: carboxypeptidase regulatory-like domain-containing protein, partial [Candidatus Acidoferrales bacterium]|nr:carboxypeptidase regulatory-like domain-containing protein [Candidatus Acidoferrales bacterium]
MKRWIHFFGLIALLLACAGAAAAQGNNRLDGQVLDAQEKPMPGVTVTIKSEDSGQTYTFKTDANGKFMQLGLRAGIYDVTVQTNNPDLPPYAEKFQLKEGQSGTLVINYKDIMAKYANSEEAKKRAEAENAFKSMKGHFDAGRQSMTQADTLMQQMKTAPADQKANIAAQRISDCQNAANEFSEAAKGVQPKDAKNTAIVLGNLGSADECAGKYDDAVDAFQKAIAAQPSAGLYTQLSTNLANSGVAQTDPAVLQSKVTEAGADCDKAAALEPAQAKVCWKNLGIVLYNKQRQKEAVTAFQKVTTLDPKDAQTWFLLGSSLAAQIDSKQVGSKLTYVIPPGTNESYQKCIDADPNGPYAPQCKAGLDELAALSGGQS